MKHKKFFWWIVFGFTVIGLMVLAGCQKNILSSPPLVLITSIPTISITPISTLTRGVPATIAPTFTSSPTPTSTPQPSPTFDQPSGCKEPIDDYSLVEINGMVINMRTYEMLLHAQSLYGGELDLTGYHLTQGSYSNEVSASFGTHSGGGAVDLSVIQYGIYNILYEDIEPLILALRIAGFAAWLRDFDQLYPGSPIHIHAIAIGDRDLSTAATDQITGLHGYFRGFNGLPQPEGQPSIPDEHGGPILCQWMVSQGYSDLRNSNP